MWKQKQKLEAEVVEAVKFLWKHFEERSWKRLNFCGNILKKEAGSGSKLESI